MHKAQDYYPGCPEPMIVSFARTGDRGAFEELVRRRQSSVRNLMRSCCGDATLADDLAQQVFDGDPEFELLPRDRFDQRADNPPDTGNLL